MTYVKKKKIGLGYINNEKSHSLFNHAIHQKDKLIKTDDDFKELKNYDFHLVNLKCGKNYGEHARLKKLQYIDVLYLIDPEVEKLKEYKIIGKDEKSLKIDGKSINDLLVKTINLNNIKEIPYITEKEFVMVKILYDISHNFKNNTEIYYRRSKDKQLLKDGDAAIDTIDGSLKNILISINKFEPIYKTKKELYKDEIKMMKKNIKRTEDLIENYYKTIDLFEKRKEKQIADLITMQNLYIERFNNK